MRLGLICLLVCAAAGGSGKDVIVAPEARAQTDPVPHANDAADDPAIWVHPNETSRSLIIGTDKQGALHVYDMDGRQRQQTGKGCLPNNVDVLYGVELGGRKVDLVLASTRSPTCLGVRVWMVDAERGVLADLNGGRAFPVFRGTTPYGICTYRSAKTGKSYFVVTSATGQVEQYELTDAGNAQIRASRMRNFGLGSIVEACVADNELGFLYIGQESVGIWKFSAEPDAASRGELIAKVGQHGMAADVEGLAVYCTRGGKGYLIASSQGNNTFKVFERDGANRFVLTIDPKAGTIDDVNDTDGIAVTNRPTSDRFPEGFLVVQDGHNSKGNQNFKIYAWEDIATDRLLIDTDWDPRGH